MSANTSGGALLITLHLRLEVDGGGKNMEPDVWRLSRRE